MSDPRKKTAVETMMRTEMSARVGGTGEPSARAAGTDAWKTVLDEMGWAWRKGLLQSKIQQSPLLRIFVLYGFAAIVVTLALVLQRCLSNWVGGNLSPFILFYPAVMVVALLGGWKPGLLAIALALIGGLWLMPPSGAFSITSPVNRLSLALFALNGGLITTVAGLYHRQSRKATDFARELAAGIERQRMAAAVQEERDRLSALINSITDEIWFADADGKVTFVNPAVRQDFGPSLGDGKELEDVAAGLEVYREDGSPRPVEEAPPLRALRGETVRNLEEIVRIPSTAELRHRQVNSAPVRAADGAIIGSVSVVRDITERKRIEDTLRFLARCGTSVDGKGFFPELAQYLAETLEMDFVCIDRLEQSHLQAHTLAMFDQGRFLDNIRYTLEDTPCGAVLGQQICAYPRGICTLFPNDEVLQHMGAESYLGVTLWDSKGQPIGLIAVIGRQPVADTSFGEAILQLVAVRAGAELERQRAEEKLRQSEERIQQALRVSHSYTFEWDPSTDEVVRSESCATILSLSGEDVRHDTGQHYFQRIHSDDRERFVQMLRSLTPDSNVYTTEYRFERGDGIVVVLEEVGQAAFDPKGNLDRVVGVATDITAHKRAAEALQASLREKDVLLHEVHHRVKNNLQIISSLVSLQAASITGPEREALGNIQDQVRAMALVHEKLYQAGDFERIEFADYARNLLGQLWRAHGEAASRATLVLNLQPVTMPLTTAVPCGLILNELSGNALKHAFKELSTGGRVTISVAGEPEGAICLRVTDNGVGLPDGFDWHNTQSLGLRLVQMLTRQLGGTAEARCPTGGGVEFEVRFVTKNELPTK